MMPQPRFTWKNREFYLDGKPFRIYSGSIHYFRSLPEQWKSHMERLKALGFNTVETYCAWNLHEPQPGKFDFSGRLDLERFLNTAQELGLYAIVRPGPYVCAEWENGGFPGWLLANPDIRIRTTDPAYTKPLTAYMDKLLPHIVPHLITNGGNVLMVAAENEYGSFGNDHAYMEWCAQLLEERGIDVPIFTADGHRQMFLNGGHAGNRLCCLDFGFHKGITYEYDALGEYMPDAPRMCVEHWVGNFTQWGEPFRKYDGEIVAHEVQRHLDLNASFNMYMFHGGTNFGFTNGANQFYKNPEDPRELTYFADTTSYDYDAPLNEWGECTPKYFAIQKVMEKHLGKKLPTPDPIPLQSLGEVKLAPAGGLFANLDTIGTRFESNQLYSMEHFGQNFGYILYRTKIDGIIDPKQLIFGTMHDRMHVYFNGVYRGTIHRNDKKQFIECTDWLENGGTLDLLVENMGRNNFGVGLLMGDRKGILDYVYVNASCRQFLSDWEIWTLPMEALDRLENKPNEKPNLPSFYKGTFKSPEKKDCFIHPDGFTKGFIVVNGFNLGRYWNIGPQYSLYLPWPILKDENEILVFDEEPTSNPIVNILDHHILDKLQEDVVPDVIV